VVELDPSVVVEVVVVVVVVLVVVGAQLFSVSTHDSSSPTIV